MQHTSNIDTTPALWEKLYHVSYPYFASRSIEDIHQNGTRVSGHKFLDDIHTKELVRGYLTVVKIIELVIDKSIVVNFLNHEDVYKVYDDIKLHLDKWHMFMQTSFNYDAKIVDDLRKMDQFARILFEGFVRYDTSRGTEYTSAFMRSISGPIFNNDVLSNLSATKKSDDFEKASQKEYSSMDDFLASVSKVRLN